MGQCWSLNLIQCFHLRCRSAFLKILLSYNVIGRKGGKKANTLWGLLGTWCHQQRTPSLLPGLPFPAHTHSHGSRCMMLSFLIVLKPTIISDDIKTLGLGGFQPTQQKNGCPNAVCLQIFHTLDYHSCLQHSVSLVSLRLCLFLSPNSTLIRIYTVATPY